MGENWSARISGYLDNELTPAERQAFEEELGRNDELANEYESIRAMKEVTAGMKLREFPDAVWERYWNGTYNRLERRAGWLLLSLGAIVLLGGGLYRLVSVLVTDESTPLWMRIALGAVCGGVTILFVSVLRERLFMRGHDPYREVKR